MENFYGRRGEHIREGQVEVSATLHESCILDTRSLGRKSPQELDPRRSPGQ